MSGVKLDGLELSTLSPWVPALQQYQFRGRLFTDLDIYNLQSDLSKLRGKGQNRLQNLDVVIPATDTYIEQANALLEMASDQFHLRHLAMRVNQQLLPARGSLRNLSSPRLCACMRNI